MKEMSMKLAIKGGTIVTAKETYRADIAIEGGRIAAIGQGLAAEEVIDASGMYIFPGAIDVHTHLELPVMNTTSADDFQSGTVAAACGGTTTIIDFADQGPGEGLAETLEARMGKAQGKAAIDYAFHISITQVSPEILEEMAQMVERGVTSFKAFLAYPGRYMLDDGSLLQILARAGELGALIMVHAENGHMVDYLTRKHLAEGKREPLWHARSHPPEAEIEAVGRAIALAAVAQAPLYLAHLTTAQGLERVEEAQGKGQPLFAETCPQYLLLTSRLYEQPFHEAAKYVISPPLRGEKDRQALWRGLASGALSVVSTDHCPFTLEQKEKGRDDFSRIPNGLPGVETRLPLLHHWGVNQGRLSLNRLVETLATEPARLFGLWPQKGEIAVAADADLVIFDPQKEVALTKENLHMKVDYSPYEGMVVRGYPTLVMQRGTVLVRDGRFVGPLGQGQFLRRKTHGA